MRKSFVIGASLLACLMAPAVANAADQPKLVCSGNAAYAGPPLRTPPIDAAFGLQGGENRPFDASTSARLDAALAKAQTATGAPAMTAAVVAPGSGAWHGQWPGVSSDPEPLLFWASAGKTFTAVAILQLADEGRLSLSEPVSKWIDGVPNGQSITIEELLNHTSGLFSANEDLAFRRTPHRLDLDETLRIVRRHGPVFCPGTAWRYSNTNYTLLGVILERVEKQPYDQIIRRRILDRLGGVRLRVVTPNDPLDDVAMPKVATGEPAIDPREPGAAGAIVGDAPGMIAFWRALLSGDLLNPATTRAMFDRLYPMFDGPESYGQGVMTYTVPAPDGGESDVWIGHSGGAPGAKAVVAYSLRRRAFVAVALTGDGSAEATANLLLRQISDPS